MSCVCIFGEGWDLRVLLRDTSDDALDFSVVLQTVFAVFASMTGHLVSSKRRLG